jgi:hypothetical protein
MREALLMPFRATRIGYEEPRQSITVTKGGSDQVTG